jgi:hypothetical protein
MRSDIPAALLALALPAAAGYYPANTAIHKDSPVFANWAGGHTVYQPGGGVDGQWQTPALAYGRATDSVYDIACLGNGGSITLFFPHPVCDGPGADFAVFENAMDPNFLELAFVEVSSDGVSFFRFASASLTAEIVGPFDPWGVDPTDVEGLAGKYPLGYGTPFDLAALPDSPALDKQHIRFIRIIDIVGDGGTRDSAGRPIYDPTPTTGSGGFDLDAVGVIHQNNGGFRVLEACLTDQGFQLAWESNPGSSYRIMESTDLETWTLVEAVAPSATTAVTRRTLPTANALRKYWRVERP